MTDVRASERLIDSPAVLVNPDGTGSSQMQRIMNIIQKDMTIPKKILEINPKHALIRNLSAILKSDKADKFFESSIERLYESALLQDGYMMDPHTLVTGIQQLLSDSSQWYLDRKEGKPSK